MEFTPAFVRSEYYQRDQDLGLDTRNQYIANLKKLGYWKFDKSAQIEKYIKHELNQAINREIKLFNLDPIFCNKTIGTFLSELKQSEKFCLHQEYLTRVETRGRILSECGYDQFYNLCTDEELAYLGW